MSVTFEFDNGKRRQVSHRDANLLTLLGKGHVAEDKPKRTKRKYKRKDMTAENDYGTESQPND